eukprot:2850604-Amphidinium_carterae.1
MAITHETSKLWCSHIVNLNSALATIKWTSVQLIITQEVTSAMPFYKLATDWRHSKYKLPNQTQTFPKRIVEWLVKP